MLPNAQYIIIQPESWHRKFRSFTDLSKARPALRESGSYERYAGNQCDWQQLGERDLAENLSEEGLTGFDLRAEGGNLCE